MNKASKGSSLQMGLGFLSLSIVAIGFIASTALVGTPVQAPRAAEPVVMPSPTPRPSATPKATMRPVPRASVKPVSK